MRDSRRIRWAAPALVAVLAAGCVIGAGPIGPDDRPFVEGRWRIDAFVLSSSCGFVDDELFTARIFQNRDFLELVVDIAGSGSIRYDGFLERDGEFFLRHDSVFPREDLRVESDVDGRFDFRGDDLTATETERIVDLRSGRSCRVVWRWRGDRR